MSDRENERILITGGNRGIGRAIAYLLAESGYDIDLTYNSGKEEAEETGKRISSLGRNVSTYQVDLSSRTQLEVFTKSILDSGKTYLAVVNNAGIYRGTHLSETSDEEWEKIIGLNLSAPFYLARDLNGSIKNSGSIVNIASVYGFRSDSWALGYQASKAALIHLTRGLAKELAPRIRVNAVAPGYVRTDLNKSAWENESFNGRIKKMTPMSRWGDPEDVARVVKFLLSPENSFITGETVVVDGGIGL